MTACAVASLWCPTISQSPMVLGDGISLFLFWGAQQPPFLTHVEDIIPLLQLHGKSPRGQVEMATVRGFHTHIGEVVGLQSFFVFYGPGGRVSAVCSAGITIQREVSESSDGAPVLQIKHIPHSHWPQSLIIHTAACLFYASSHLLVTSLTSSADAAFHFLSLRRTSTQWNTDM